jgi:hypothetical protein
MKGEIMKKIREMIDNQAGGLLLILLWLIGIPIPILIIIFLIRGC